MGKITGKLGDMLPRNTSKGTAYDLYVVNPSESKVIGTFRPGEAKPGDTVEVDYVENGQYLNASSIKVITKGPVVPVAPKVPQKTLPEFDATDVRDIDIGSAVKEAVRCMGKDANDEEIEKMAERIVRINIRLKSKYKKPVK